MVGTIITARITLAENLSEPVGVPWKRGRNPRRLCTAGSMELAIAGARTLSPQNPYTTEGTAARSSTTYVRGTRSFGGASSDRKIATPREIGTPRRSAKAEVTRVP